MICMSCCSSVNFLGVHSLWLRIILVMLSGFSLATIMAQWIASFVVWWLVG